MSAASASEDELRFQSELEFVQYLSQGRYFEEPAFVNYLAYLQYWKQPEYAQFIVYPMCLQFLDLLQSESFRKELGNAQFIDNVLYKQQFNHWRFHQANRMQEAMLLLENAANLAKAAASAAATTDEPASTNQN